MLVRQITDDHLAQNAYLIGCQQTGEAVIIDPERDVERYIEGKWPDKSANQVEKRPSGDRASDNARMALLRPKQSAVAVNLCLAPVSMNLLLAIEEVSNAKNPCRHQPTGVSLYNSLTITYFHTGCSTIIGAKSFHGPVRDGKGWDRLAMVIRHDLYDRLLSMEQQSISIWKK